MALLGNVIMLLPRFLVGRARVRGADVLEVLAESSSRALVIVGVVNVLMGAILAFVGAVQLQRFGAGIYVADLVGIASVRELTPIITGIVLAGRTGASFAARIATMQGNEEIDALTTLGISPAEFLVVPRVAALTLLMPLLYVYGCAFAVVGGLWVAGPTLDLSSAAYWAQMRDAVRSANFAIGGLKAAVFGALVALLGCHYGLRADRSAAGVGSATTSAESCHGAHSPDGSDRAPASAAVTSRGSPGSARAASSYAAAGPSSTVPDVSITATGMRAHSTRRTSRIPHSASTIPMTTER